MPEIRRSTFHITYQAALNILSAVTTVLFSESDLKRIFLTSQGIAGINPGM